MVARTFDGSITDAFFVRPFPFFFVRSFPPFGSFPSAGSLPSPRLRASIADRSFAAQSTVCPPWTAGSA